LGRGIHLRSVAGGHGLRAGTKSAGHRTAALIRAWLFLVQGEGVDEAAVRGLRGGAKVEDPDDDDHRQQNETSTSSLFGTMGAVNGVVCADRGKDKGGTEVTNDGDTIDITGVGTEDEDQANVNTEHVSDRPPVQVRIIGLNIGDNGRDEGDQPRQDRDGKRGQRKGVAQDIAGTEVGHFGGLR